MTAITVLCPNLKEVQIENVLFYQFGQSVTDLLTTDQLRPFLLSSPNWQKVKIIVKSDLFRSFKPFLSFSSFDVQIESVAFIDFVMRDYLYRRVVLTSIRVEDLSQLRKLKFCKCKDVDPVAELLPHVHLECVRFSSCGFIPIANAIEFAEREQPFWSTTETGFCLNSRKWS